MQSIKPTSHEHWLELRSKDLTSTEISSLFNLSPYMTEFELHHRKASGAVITIEESERMYWGNKLQDAIAEGIAEKKGWKIRRMDEYARIPELRIGSSFDYMVLEPTPGLLEIKNVDGIVFKDGWEADDDGNLEAPPHIELQVQHQLMITGMPVCWIGTLVGGNKIQILERRPDERIWNEIKEKAAEFWGRIDRGEDPNPDFVRDAEFISQLYGFAEPGKVIDVEFDEDFAELAGSHRHIGQEIKRLEELRDACKAQMLMKMGDAEKAVGNGFSVSAGVVAGAYIAYDRKPYRTFRTNWKKVK